MSLEEGESEKCYRFLEGGVHGWHGPTAAFRGGPLSTQSCRSVAVEFGQKRPSIKARFWPSAAFLDAQHSAKSVPVLLTKKTNAYSEA